MSAPGYVGASARSRRERRVYVCPCGERFPVELWRAIDLRADPEAGRSFIACELNRGACPACGALHEVQVSVLYHDAAAERLALVLPDALRHRELEERARLYALLATDGDVAPEYVRRFDVVFGPAELARLLGDAVAPARPESTVVTPLRLPPEAERAPRPRTSSHPLALPTPAPEGEGALSDGEDTRKTKQASLAVPDTQSAAVERWTMGREPPSAFVADGRVLFCAALSRAELAAVEAAPLELRVQLHRLPSYPLVVLTVLPVQPSADPATQAVIHAPLDVARAAHRAVLDQLTKSATVTFLLYDADYQPLSAREVAAPLEENAARLLREAKDALSRLAPAARSFDRARAAFVAPGFERLGRIHVALSDVELGALSSPAALRNAVATVARWSEPGAEAYLAEVRSFPLGQFRTLRADVVRAAIEHGVHCPRALTLKVLADEKVEADWPAVLRRQISAFTEVALRLRENDLSPDEEADNWRLLVAECQAAQVALDPQVERLARSADRRARAVAGGGVDLRALSTGELTALLERKELRREAAQLLCERRVQAALPSMVAALRKMTRAEANRVLPALTLFEQAAEPSLVELLRSRKSFLRQGAALALAVVAGPRAAEAVARMLVEEPTEMWPELARAAGDLGAPAVTALLGRLRANGGDAERRERVARALAHVAHRSGRALLEAHARDAALAPVLKRAAELEDEVRRGDGEVRGAAARPAVEQTVIRGFSRRFFEALAGAPGALELSDDDLEEVVAEAGDGAGSSDGGDGGGEDDGLEELSEDDLLPGEPQVGSRSTGDGPGISFDPPEEGPAGPRATQLSPFGEPPADAGRRRRLPNER